MSTSTTTATNALSRLDAVPQAPPDPILGVSEAFRADTSPQRLNLGVGAYRTEELKPWVLPVVVEAERRMLAAGNDKEYLPIEGFAPFNAATARLLLGDGSPALSEKRCATIQCLSGTGSLRIGADFIAKFLPRGTKVFVSDPTWGNHFNIFGDAGLECGKYRYFDAKTVGLDFEGMIADLDSVPKGSVIVLHGRMVFFLPLFFFGLFFLQKHKSSEQVRRPVALLKPPMPEETRKQSNRCDIGMDWESYWPAQEILSNSARQSMKRPPTFFPHFLFAQSKTLKKKKNSNVLKAAPTTRRASTRRGTSGRPSPTPATATATSRSSTSPIRDSPRARSTTTPGRRAFSRTSGGSRFWSRSRTPKTSVSTPSASAPSTLSSPTRERPRAPCRRPSASRGPSSPTRRSTARGSPPRSSETPCSSRSGRTR